MRCLVPFVGSLALLVGVPTPAFAYEDHAALGVAVGYAGLPVDTALPRNGLDLALTAGGGFGEAWSLQGRLSYDLLFDAAPLHLGTAGLETVYALDIVRFVPLFGFGVDGLLSIRERVTHGDFALHALVGVDFLVDPRWLVGADVRVFWVTTHRSSPLPAVLLTAAFRVGVRFGLR